jgi:hypothetical protein
MLPGNWRSAGATAGPGHIAEFHNPARTISLARRFIHCVGDRTPVATRPAPEALSPQSILHARVRCQPKNLKSESR